MRRGIMRSAHAVLTTACIAHAVATQQRVFVVGASRGIGLELARAFAVSIIGLHCAYYTPEKPLTSNPIPLVTWHTRCDEQLASVCLARSNIAQHSSIDLLIHVAGVNKGTCGNWK